MEVIAALFAIAMFFVVSDIVSAIGRVSNSLDRIATELKKTRENDE